MTKPPKQRCRKPPLRKPGRPKPHLDDDLAELALVLAEHKSRDDVDGWFSIPWRDGWNAAYLCRAAWLSTKSINADNDASHESSRLGDWIHQHSYVTQLPEIYEESQTLGASASVCYKQGNEAARFLVAGMRCVQLTISNSHGGGHVFNDVLKLAFRGATLLWNYHGSQMRIEIMAARCLDAIGVTPTLRNDRHDRLRRAFTIAWERGLYHAAYSLPRATYSPQGIAV